LSIYEWQQKKQKNADLNNGERADPIPTARRLEAGRHRRRTMNEKHSHNLTGEDAVPESEPRVKAYVMKHHHGGSASSPITIGETIMGELVEVKTSDWMPFGNGDGTTCEHVGNNAPDCNKKHEVALRLLDSDGAIIHLCREHADFGGELGVAALYWDGETVVFGEKAAAHCEWVVAYQKEHYLDNPWAFFHYGAVCVCGGSWECKHGNPCGRPAKFMRPTADQKLPFCDVCMVNFIKSLSSDPEVSN
jgi:hypothetical protein